MLNRWTILLGVQSLLLAATPYAAAGANTNSPFGGLIGFWSGRGQVHFGDGDTEKLLCRAYYNAKNSGNGLGLSIRCAKSDQKIELRATLASQDGKVTGVWEERTFNANGLVAGTVADDRMSLTIDGGGFSGTMEVTHQENNQTVLIKFRGINIDEIRLSLSRQSGGLATSGSMGEATIDPVR